MCTETYYSSVVYICYCCNMRPTFQYCNMISEYNFRNWWFGLGNVFEVSEWESGWVVLPVLVLLLIQCCSELFAARAFSRISFLFFKITSDRDISYCFKLIILIYFILICYLGIGIFFLDGGKFNSSFCKFNWVKSFTN